MQNKKRLKVSRKDHFRALVTETSPAETPIIFSNDGFYIRSIKNESTSTGLAEDVYETLVKQADENRWHIPYAYKIKKSALSHRSLVVPHPSSQWKIAEFYKNYFALIVHYTTKCDTTLRAPKSVASSYFIRADFNDLSKYKRSQVSTTGFDQNLSHSPSYFSYQGYGRLYKFFDSSEFIELEENYNLLWMLDVSKCFDSIYTHTLLWAIKDKDFSKESFKSGSFGQKFDKLMQSINFGETSGIVIGPEVSRIFAEIILQRIDLNVRAKLSNSGLENGVNYTIKRYVDDYFIFSKDEATARRAFAIIEAELLEFKLSVNDGKIRKYSRPFLTPKSKAILDANRLLNEFIEKFTCPPQNSSGKIVASEIYKIDRLFISFCNDVKSCCIDNQCEYEEVSGYLISALKGRALSITDSYERKGDAEDGYTYEALALILKCMFFLYRVAPSVTASYRVSTTAIVIVRFSKAKLEQHANALITLLLAETTRVMDSAKGMALVDGFVDLETQNILLAVSEFSAELRIPSRILERSFIRNDAPPSYFNLVSAMFYIKSGANYSFIRKWISDSIEQIANRKTSVRDDAEKALTLLDFIGCPYIDFQRRVSWARVLLQQLGLPTADMTAVEVLVKDFESLPWFVDWKEIDLLNLLERKELRAVY
jgi:hypothetical protein